MTCSWTEEVFSLGFFSVFFQALLFHTYLSHLRRVVFTFYVLLYDIARATIISQSTSVNDSSSFSLYCRYVFVSIPRVSTREVIRRPCLGLAAGGVLVLDDTYDTSNSSNEDIARL